MDKLKYILIFIFSIFFTQTMALSWDIQHFKTTDWKHMCSLASESNFKSCVLFWIKYKNDEVTFWQKPSLETWSWNYIVVKNTSWDMCVHNWLEVDVTNCKMLQSWTFSRDNLTQTWNTQNITQSWVDSLKSKYVDNSKEIQQKLDSVNELLKQAWRNPVSNSWMVQTWVEINQKNNIQTKNLTSTSSLKTNELTQDNELSQTWNEVNPTTIDFATNELDIQETNSWEDLSWTSASTVENNDSQVIDWMVKWLDNTAENDYLNNSDLWVYSLGIFIWGILLIILNFICYLVNLIHAIRNPIPNKLLWIVLLLIVWITYILYYFIVKRPFDKAKKQEKNNNISGQNYWFKSEVQDDVIKIGQDDVSFWTGLKKEEKTQDFNFEIK